MMSTEASRSYDRGYADGGEQARDEIVDAIFDILADAKDQSMTNSGYSGTWAAVYISDRLDRYIDENRKAWGNV